MAKLAKRQQRLWDTYASPGFRPQPVVRGVFGDPKACVISLVRRSKKQFAAAAGGLRSAGTTGVYAKCATCLAATGAFIWNLRCGVFSASAAKP